MKDPRAALTVNLQPDDTILTDQGRRLRVIARVGQGKRGVVFQVQDADGTLYALKVARDSLPDSLESMAQEPRKAALYRKHGVPHSRIVESNSHYVLKEWIEGTRADDWIKAWASERSEDARPIENLRTLIHAVAGRGVYIGDLSPRNLIWDGERWVVIDSGGIKEGFAAEDAFSRYVERIPRRWSKKGKNRPLFHALQQSLLRK